MWLLILEALLALGALVFIVAWTMSGRRRDEPSAPATVARSADEGPRAGQRARAEGGSVADADQGSPAAPAPASHRPADAAAQPRDELR